MCVLLPTSNQLAFSVACQTSMSAQMVFNWLWQLLVKSNQTTPNYILLWLVLWHFEHCGGLSGVI